MIPLSVQTWRRFLRFYRKDIWQPAQLTDRSLKGRFYALLRVISITSTVFLETKAASRAAALTFSSLLGLGPLVAIAISVAGFVLDKNNNPNLAVETLNRLITYIAPPVGEYQKLVEEGAVPQGTQASQDILSATVGPGPAAPATPAPAPAAAPAGTSAPASPPAPAATTPPVAVNPEMVKLLEGFIAGSKSGTAGVFGALTLIVIVIQLFTSIENSFNEIWGVRRGRSWLLRIVFYWTLLTLGSVVFFGAITLLGAGAFMTAFKSTVLGEALMEALLWILPSISLALLIVVLTLFYRFIPNTSVMWRTAVIGALVVAALLVANNYMAVFYLSRVVQTKSFYGSLGILPILMLGLYIFWLFVLVGCQISYAVQNVDYRSSQAAWSGLADATRQRLALVVLLTVCRRFQACLPPVTALHLGEMLKVPTQILNECLNRLVDLKIITPVPPAEGDDASDHAYQPARPLDRITLADFRHLFEHYGNDPLGDTIDRIDPVIRQYHDRVDALSREEFFTKSLDQLFADQPFEESQPPFQTMTVR